MNEPVRILVVEDEENIRKILEYSLKIDGFDVFLAENGRMALELAQTEKPDVILLDWMMPEMDGLAVLSRLKNNKETEDIPVFMLTAKGVMSDVGRALYEGADDYITKPFDPVQLGEVIRAKLDKCSKV